MEVVICADESEVGALAASIVAARVAAEPATTIGLATGSSPLGAYRRLTELVNAGELSFARASAATLDEYVGLPDDHPQSYRNVIRRDFIDRVDLDPGRLHTPAAHADDVAAACQRYDRIVVEHAVAIQLLGLGTDGHLAFNEPGSSLVSRTRIKTLTERTRADNARFFGSIDDVPRHVITQGLGTISDAEHLVLIALGDAKAAPVRDAVEGPVSAACPASIIQLHPHVTVLVDEPAASRLERAEYYRHAYANKPVWQGL